MKHILILFIPIFLSLELHSQHLTYKQIQTLMNLSVTDAEAFLQQNRWRKVSHTTSFVNDAVSIFLKKRVGPLDSLYLSLTRANDFNSIHYSFRSQKQFQLLLDSAAADGFVSFSKEVYNVITLNHYLKDSAVVMSFATVKGRKLKSKTEYQLDVAFYTDWLTDAIYPTGKETWTLRDRAVFMQGCLSRTKNIRITEAKEYCACIQVKVENKYTANEMDKLKPAEMMEIVNSCKKR